MPAQVEEIVVDTDVLDLQEVAPNGGEGLLGVRERPGHVRWTPIGCDDRSGQRVAIDLAVGGQGELVHQDERGRDHVSRQPAPQLATQRRGSQNLSVRRDRRPDKGAGGLMPHETRFG